MLFSIEGPVTRSSAALLVQPSLQLVPEPLVRPLVDVILERTLQVIAAAVHRAHGAERKASLVVGVNQFVVDRRRLRQDAEPAERIDPLEGLDRRRLDAGAADAVEAVAAGDEIAVDLAGHAVLDIGDARTVGVEIMRLDVGGLIDRGQPRGLARVHQVERHLGLAVDHHRLAGRGLHVDAVPAAAEGELDAVMDQALAVGARAGADFVEQRHRALFQKAGADAAEHVFRRLALQDDVVDAVAVKQLP